MLEHINNITFETLKNDVIFSVFSYIISMILLLLRELFFK